jgi:hypothetical protein
LRGYHGTSKIYFGISKNLSDKPFDLKCRFSLIASSSSFYADSSGEVTENPEEGKNPVRKITDKKIIVRFIRFSLKCG